MTFEQLGLTPTLLKALADSGYTEPTSIQAMAIPEALAGHDLMASAQTGTGKTAAFMLPSLNRICTPSAVRSRGPRVLVLAPTRELATQVADAAKSYGKYIRLSVMTLLGGMSYYKQNQMLAKPIDIMVATPGRLMDQMARGRVDFSRLEVLVLDEADRMLDMGFIDDVRRIAAETPDSRQTLLFSATLDGQIGVLAKQLLKNPKLIQASAITERHEHIEQQLFYSDDYAHKNRMLQHVLRGTELRQAVVFTATKRDADDLAVSLQSEGFSAAALHGDMNQSMRNRTLMNLRRGALKVLVATDVAARGIDVQNISHVINFDLPRDTENYVHRIGRTGRAGASGLAISFVSGKDQNMVRRIERYIGQRIKTHVIPGMEPRKQAVRAGRTEGRGRSSQPNGARPVGKPGFKRHERRPGGASQTGAQSRSQRQNNVVPS
ncbi:MAG: DEAD/DEAH box helicase [Proteobacteria bacterium]|nr:DEAD/DEAH box helicase [Pseudomonadota bacterium]MDE3207561.1 DEAD/DEAH box helicase [Pseudomonadota bacterium]